MVVFRGYACHEMQKAERRMLKGNSPEKRVYTRVPLAEKWKYGV